MGGNLDLVRSICEPWACGDFRETEWADRDIEYAHVDGPTPGRWTGPAAMAGAFGQVLNAYADYRVVAEEFRVLDDERVLVLHRYSGRGRTSGIDVADLAAKGADLFHVSDRKVKKLTLYWQLDRAISDLGLET